MVADLIAQIRAAGLTQQQIAERLGVRQNTVSDYATGKRGHVRPSAHVLDGLRALHQEVCGSSPASSPK